MTNTNIINLHREFDPWVHKPENKQPVPESAELVCIIELIVGLDTLNELIWFHRTDEADELWSLITLDDSARWPNLPDANLLKGGRVVISTRGGALEKSAYRLLQDFIRLRAGHAWPSGFIAQGLLDEQTFKTLLKDTETRFENNIKVARQLESPLIKVARRLGLGPQPLPTSCTAWQAHCPGTNHSLYISSQSDTFECGYCRKKGGADELKAFVKARREKGKTWRAAQ